MPMLHEPCEAVAAETEARAVRSFTEGPVVLFVWKAEEGWPVEYVSPNVERNFGHCASDFTCGRLAYTALIHPDDLARVTEDVRVRIAQRDDRYEQEYRLKCADGAFRWVQDHTVVERDAAGAPARFCGYVIDITARKESETRYRRIVEMATEGVWMMDAARRTTYVNPQMCAMLGVRAGAMLGNVVTEFMFPEDLPVHEERMRARAHGLGSRYDQRFRRADGQAVWCRVSATAVLDEYGRFSGSFATFVDITERIRTEEALRRSEKLNTDLLNATHDSAFLLGLDGRIIALNAFAAERLGRPAGELVGTVIYDHLPPDVATRRRTLVTGAVRQGCPLRFEDERDGRVFEHHVYPVRGANEEVTAVAAFARDVTAQKATEDTLRRTTALVDSVREAQGRFLAGGDDRAVFASLLQTLVSLTGSEYGFLDEVLPGADGVLYKRSLALSDIAWDSDSRALYRQLSARNLEFRALDNLAGLPAVSARLVLANDVPHDARGRGVPKGHPPIRTYMGVPMFFGGELVGVAGVANRPGGYTEEIASFLEPFTRTCAGIIHAVRAARKESELRDTLRANEEKFRIVAENARDWEFWRDEEGRYVYSSPSCARVTGYPPATFAADPDLLGAIVHPDDRALLARHVAEVETPHAAGECVFRVVRADGACRLIEHVCQSAIDAEGRYRGVRASNRDITGGAAGEISR
jgi:PAS domain S-box-containing protein